MKFIVEDLDEGVVATDKRFIKTELMTSRAGSPGCKQNILKIK